MLDFYHREFNVLRVHDDHRERHRHSDGQHHHHQSRGPVGTGAAAPTARPRRPLAPSGIRVSAGAAAQRVDAGRACKRLEAIESLEELGSGFTLATHDLEIRGAGELLGEGQSGQIQAIGFTLYNELLGPRRRGATSGRRARSRGPVHARPGDRDRARGIDPGRLHARRAHAPRALQAHRELPLERRARRRSRSSSSIASACCPPPLKTLFSITALKLLAASSGSPRFRPARRTAASRSAERSRVDPTRLLKLIESDSKRYRLDGPYKLRSRGRSTTPTSASPPWKSCCAAWAPRTRLPPRPETLYRPHERIFAPLCAVCCCAATAAVAQAPAPPSRGAAAAALRGRGARVREHQLRP